ncbi:hypothetical protein [Bacillus timonensis]|nr:hypothetical protein [Bacillus timonensis]
MAVAKVTWCILFLQLSLLLQRIFPFVPQEKIKKEFYTNTTVYKVEAQST